jgi:hypothetical protein
LSEFLIELSIGVNRYAMYPAGHPSHDPVLDNILRRLSELFVDRPPVSIGVAARELIIEGMATDQKHPVLLDLAKRLHEHQLGAISFERGVKPFEVAGLLEILAEESARGGMPIGMREGDDFPRWELLKVHPVGYEKLELKDDTGEEPSGELDRATTLWLGLAQAALASDETFAAPPDATTISAYHRRARARRGIRPGRRWLHAAAHGRVEILDGRRVVESPHPGLQAHE